MYVSVFINCMEGGLSFEEIDKDYLLDHFEGGNNKFSEYIEEIAHLFDGEKENIRLFNPMSAYGVYELEDSEDDIHVIVAASETEAALAFFNHFNTRKSVPEVTTTVVDYAIPEEGLKVEIEFEGINDEVVLSNMLQDLMNNTTYFHTSGTNGLFRGIIQGTSLAAVSEQIVDIVHNYNNGLHCQVSIAEGE